MNDSSDEFSQSNINFGLRQSGMLDSDTNFSQEFRGNKNKMQSSDLISVEGGELYGQNSL